LKYWPCAKWCQPGPNWNWKGKALAGGVEVKLEWMQRQSKYVQACKIMKLKR